MLNDEGKIFFSVLARRMTNFLLENGYVDTSCQKVGVPGFPGCMEHSSVIWEHIQWAKRERSDLHVVWVDVANAYVSVPYQLLNYTTEFFHMPCSIRSPLTNDLKDLRVAFSLQEFTTG